MVRTYDQKSAAAPRDWPRSSVVGKHRLLDMPHRTSTQPTLYTLQQRGHTSRPSPVDLGEPKPDPEDIKKKKKGEREGDEEKKGGDRGSVGDRSTPPPPSLHSLRSHQLIEEEDL